MKLSKSQIKLLWYIATNEPAKLEDLARWAGLSVGAARASLTSLANKKLALTAYGRWSLSLNGIREHRARMENVRGA